MSFFQDFMVGSIIGSVAASGLFLCCSGRYTAQHKENKHRMKLSRLVRLAPLFCVLLVVVLALVIVHTPQGQNVSISPIPSVATRAASVRQSAQKVTLDWHGVGSAGPKPFSISDQAWQLYLVCGVVSGTSPHALIVHLTLPGTGLRVPVLTYVCPVGAGGGQTMALLGATGDLSLSVESADANVSWEVIVTDLP
jgi:hypothetical protein